ncbi:lytic transglycosylase domain-containing protein [Nonomuraea sp. NPDC050536]|uniref:aggregation-promoting factor C-terminal-like domain-containing protein n=1 Tax=Nonomuraea sp. NPDC050536 TaxID=3364366 RepID=UPI0037C9B606
MLRRTRALVLSAAIVAAGAGTATAAQADTTSTAGRNKAIAKHMVAKRGWGHAQYRCLVSLWNRESGWRHTAGGSAGPYGIPQALPGRKMATAGHDWRTNPRTQIAWGLGYIKHRYGTPCHAWAHFRMHHWY